jgi:hypothetical protein
MSKFEVQEYTLCDGWVNTWTHTQDGSDEPVYFNSEADAQTELDWFLHDILQEVEAGNMADVPDKNTFRIVEVSDEQRIEE